MDGATHFMWVFLISTSQVYKELLLPHFTDEEESNAEHG